MAAQQKLQLLTDEFQKLQGELQNNIQARQKLEAQEQENRGVQREFAGLDDDAGIYKLVGPVLLKQERSEAVQTVDGRLAYIGGEIKRLDALIAESQGKSERKKAEIFQLQSSMQQQQQPQPAASATA